MNQPIRCEPLPFVRPNGEAAAEAPLCTEESAAEFGELLNAELGDPAVEQESKDDKNETEAVEAYGVAPSLLQLVFTEIPQLKGAVAHLRSDVSVEQETLTLPAAQAPEPESAAASEQTGAPGEQEQNASTLHLKLLQPEKLAGSEQKVPIPPKLPEAALEQISPKAPEPAKTSSGMVAAQRPPMLMTSQSHDETVPPAEQRLGLTDFDEAAFEQPIRVQPVQSRPVQPEKAYFPEVTAVDSEFPPTPRFEALPGEIDLQPVRPVEPSTVVEAIRTHIELLRSSSAEKLDVVLRPDAQTELHLQVEKVNGQVQVQARCDRGDFAALEANWTTIQSTLATQGIRVEPLQHGSGAQLQQNGSHSSQNFSGQHSPHSNQREERPAVFIEQDLRNREGTQAKTSRGSAARGWQSWA